MAAPSRPARLARHLLGDRRGTAIIEFAIAAPVLLMVFVAAYVISDEIECSRKSTITARELTDLITRFGSISQSTTLQTIFGDDAQIMQPYNAANVSLRVSEVLVTTTVVGAITTSTGTVQWSQIPTGSTQANTALAIGAVIALPAGIAPTGAYLIVGEDWYSYTPVLKFGSGYTQQFYNEFYMSPRISSSIALTA